MTLIKVKMGWFAGEWEGFLCRLKQPFPLERKGL